MIMSSGESILHSNMNHENTITVNVISDSCGATCDCTTRLDLSWNNAVKKEIYRVNDACGTRNETCSLSTPHQQVTPSVGPVKENMNIRLRKSKPSDIQFMREMLYEAVFWRPNPNKPSLKEGLADPGVRNALVDWGEREGDAAVIALDDSKPVGAAWYRFYTDDNCIRGYMDKTVPVIVIAVHNNYRRQGIGEKMIEWLIDHASKHSIQELSLMVSKDNHAIMLYRKCGFLEYADTGDSLLMLRKTET